MTAPACERLDCLDAARGAAALLVLIEHGLHWTVPSYLAFSTQNVVVGQAAILVFFMVSGFVVPMSFEAIGSVKKFWLRRCFRLFPVYWASIALAAVFLACGLRGGIGVRADDGLSWLANIAILQGFTDRPNVLGVFWSLHYEVILYVVFSIVFAARVLPRLNTRWLGAILAGYVLVSLIRPLTLHKLPADGYMAQVLQAGFFGFVARQHLAGRVSRRGFYALFGGIVLANALVEAANATVLSAAAVQSRALRQAVTMGLAFPFFAWLIERRHRQMPKAVLWIGQRSYPLYLMHPLVLTVLAESSFAPPVYIPIFFAASFVLADLAHRLVENPGIALGRRFDRRRMTNGEAAPLRRAA